MICKNILWWKLCDLYSNPFQRTWRVGFTVYSPDRNKLTGKRSPSNIDIEIWLGDNFFSFVYMQTGRGILFSWWSLFIPWLSYKCARWLYKRIIIRLGLELGQVVISIMWSYSKILVITVTSHISVMGPQIIGNSIVGWAAFQNNSSKYQTWWLVDFPRKGQKCGKCFMPYHDDNFVVIYFPCLTVYATDSAEGVVP